MTQISSTLRRYQSSWLTTPPQAGLKKAQRNLRAPVTPTYQKRGAKKIRLDWSTSRIVMVSLKTSQIGRRITNTSWPATESTIKAVEQLGALSANFTTNLWMFGLILSGFSCFPQPLFMSLQHNQIHTVKGKAPSKILLKATSWMRLVWTYLRWTNSTFWILDSVRLNRILYKTIL